MKLERNIFTLRKVEFLRNKNMEEESIFLKEEEEPEEVKLDVMPVEKHVICIGNSQRGINTLEEEKNTFLKNRSMWK
jgi:hypothetical protein